MLITPLAFLLLAAPTALLAQDDAAEDESTDTTEAEDTAAKEQPLQEPGGPKVMSGMSILGNEEAPKSLVIIPWKSSEIGDDLGLADGLDESARPVDKEVFLRELAFYKIRSGE
jgi:hypothetical protein